MTRLSLNARAQLLSSTNSQPLSPDDLDYLTNDLSTTELQELIRLLSLEFHDLQRLDSLLPRLRTHLQHPPGGDDPVHSLTRLFGITSLDGATTPPPSSPEPPQSPIRRVSIQSAPSTPARPRQAVYSVSSPSLSGYTTNWLQAGTATQGVPGASVGTITQSPKTRAPSPGAYVVFFGHVVAVFERWVDTQRQITGYDNAYQCGFPSLEAGEKALAYARSKGWTSDSPQRTVPYPVPSSYEPNPLNSPLPGGPSRWFAVRAGTHPGIYSSGVECHINVAGVKNSVFKGFRTRAEAEAAFIS
ncbi:hypothetical protein C8R43DRAFT_1122735 [Mycena crocata]|nr:hypothetical protein C8R43DRAFT_1122735 [Mycena crocata]